MIGKDADQFGEFAAGLVQLCRLLLRVGQKVGLAGRGENAADDVAPTPLVDSACGRLS